MNQAVRNSIPSDEVRGALTFIVPQDSKPYFESSALTGGEPKVHFKTEDRTVVIHDMRPLAGDLSLDREGFELLRHETTVDDLYDDQAVADAYDGEIEVLLKAATAADRVAIFDHTRRSDGPTGAANPDGLRGPASRVHVDYTPKSGPQRARDAMGAAEVDRILGSGGHIVQVNVWRPISGPVRRSPLALADAASIEPEELVATDQVFPDRVGEIYQLAHGPGQRWYWAPDMERDEVLLIKGWDSRDDGRAQFTPHGACRLANKDPEAPPRESIETRTYLVFEG
ncbi:MAG: CmcJ/NvfI family oxidoreductase [Alphaproteobacteria bacterium]|nr:CmcJ/NvfI family oxidoreductase [Alphaproteobacteria bacterium]MDP6566989.1 CmcJ/NvfI family oxidoreductase [Alphaproteobacteria bacterium]MDP6812168.1 CmcJ/NvfI family oxidoreductase [Alphaproteobacteria bacterium]